MTKDKHKLTLEQKEIAVVEKPQKKSPFLLK